MKLYRTDKGVWFAPGTINPKHAERVDVPTDTAGLCAWLNGLAAPERDPVDTPDRESWAEAQGELTTAYTGPLVPASRAPSYTEQSIKLDDDFDRLPLARQLDLAARAMENARAKL